MRVLLILLLLYPFAEIYSLSALSDVIGGGWTLLWVIFTFVLGMAMMRNSKLATLLTIGATLRQGQVSLFSLLWPLRIMLAGLLFLIPGLISDVFALLLLLPWRGPVLADMRAPTQPGPASDAGGEDIIEGEYQRVDKTVDPGSRLH